MSVVQTKDKVLIVGAGLGGLALAQVLKNYGVPFEIFERDTSLHARKQGWAVALIESVPELKKHLPESLAHDLHTNSVNYKVFESDSLGFVDAFTGKSVMTIGGVPQGQPGYILRVSREKFRDYLWTTNDLPVSVGKKFVRYEEDAQGVTAFFDDGTSARGTLLVGADGLHSHIIDQLTGSRHNPVLSEYVPIFGEIDLPPSLYKPLLRFSNAIVLASAPGIRLQIGVMGYSANQEVGHYFWALLVQSKQPEKLTNWVHSASKQELFDYVMSFAKDFDPAIRDVFATTGPKGLPDQQPKFYEYYMPEGVPANRVTVLGDAAHAMIPLRGAGANTAILDSCDLGVALADAWKEKRDFASVLPAYLEKMIPRGKENVLSSRRAGQSDGNQEVQHWGAAFGRSR